MPGSAGAEWLCALSVRRPPSVHGPLERRVAGKNAPPWVAEPTKLMAAAISSAKLEWIESGHLVSPAHPVMLAFVEEVLARR